MTKLSYVVGGEEFTSYTMAVARSQELHTSITRRYTPIKEESHVDPEMRERRLAAIRAKAAKRGA